MASNEVELTELISDWFDRRVRQARDHFEEYDLDKATIVHRISLILTLIIAIIVRTYPILLGWDPTIKAFDPWMQLRAAEYILANGFFDFLTWYDTFSWYPYGSLRGASLYFGVPLAIVLVYNVLTFLGFNISIQLAATLVPVIFGTITIIASYLLAKELISKRAALFTAMIMAVTPSFLSRSILGFVDNESIGVLFTVLAFYFFSRAFLRDSNRSAVIAGLFMFALGSSWGAFRFAFDLLPLIALVMVITGKMTHRFMRAYISTVSISTILIMMVPRTGGQFITDLEGLAPIGMVAFLVLFSLLQDLSKNLSPEAFRNVIVLGFASLTIILGGIFTILVATGLIDNIGSKFISVLFPTVRNDLPLIDSVSEHLPLAWGSLYSNLSTLVFFVPMGIFFAIKNPTEKNIFILVFGLVTIYFSGSMVRLMLILAPAAAILTALAIDNLLLPFAYATHGRLKLTKVTMSLKSIGGQNAVGAYLTVFALMAIMLSGGIVAAGERFSTPEITPGSTPDQALTDWLEAFDWMQKNTNFNQYSENNYQGLENGQPPVMLSWWDYGYYITANGDTITLVDNATSNSTQIGVVGSMLMYNESMALPLMYKYNIKHVLVVPAGGQLGLGSDIGKSIWMIRIAEQNAPQFGITEDDYFNNNAGGGYTDKYFDSVMWKLMAYHAPDMGEDTNGVGRPPFYSGQGGAQGGMNNLVPDFRSEGVVNSLEFFTEVFRSTGVIPATPGLYPFIRIFEVNYPSDIEQRVNDFDEILAQTA